MKGLVYDKEKEQFQVMVTVNYDHDKNGVPSLGAEVALFLNAKELAKELLKDKVPDWLSSMMIRKSKGESLD